MNKELVLESLDEMSARGLEGALARIRDRGEDVDQLLARAGAIVTAWHDAPVDIDVIDVMPPDIDEA